MSDNITSAFILLSIFLILSFVYSYVRWKNRTRRAEETAALWAAWGNPISRERDFALLRSLWGIRKLPPGVHHLDDQTWQDLNLDLIFENIDRTYSLPGQIGLYHLLRTPETQPAVLNDRDRMVTLFQTNATLRPEPPSGSQQRRCHGMERPRRCPPHKSSVRRQTSEPDRRRCRHAFSPRWLRDVWLRSCR
jgi:hypothetical protein